MVRTRKRFGQNFLIDEGVIDRIVSVVGLSDSDRVLEIGPGTGAITSRLHEIAKENYTAIEIDRDLVRLLSDRYPNLTILNEDVLAEVIPRKKFFGTGGCPTVAMGGYIQGGGWGNGLRTYGLAADSV